MKISSHKMTIVLVILMGLLSGCAADELQRFRNTIEMALDTTQKALDTVERGAKIVQCMKDNTCPAQEEEPTRVADSVH